MTRKSISDKGKDITAHPNEEVIPSPRTSAARLMAIKENMVELNNRMNELQTSVEHIARQLENPLNALPCRQEDVNKNIERMGVWRIAGQNPGLLHPKSNEETSKSSDDTQNLLRHYQLPEPIMGIQDSEDWIDEEDEVQPQKRDK